MRARIARRQAKPTNTAPNVAWLALSKPAMPIRNAITAKAETITSVLSSVLTHNRFLPTPDPLSLILRFTFRNRLPPHIRRRVYTATRKRLDVVNHVPRPAVGVPGLPRERVSRSRTPLDASALVARY